MEGLNIQFMGANELTFDLENPRMVEYHFTEETSVKTIVNTLWEQMAVEELVMSILAQGFFAHEPIYAIHENGKLVVVEGNRRLAAVTAILNPAIIDNGKMERFVDRITSEVVEQLKSRIPVLILADRKDAWRYIGYKHVNGAAKWGAYAKAHYIAHVHRDFGISLEKIAEQIGDANNTVKKMYQGYLVLEQAMDQTGFKLEDTYSKRIYFSHLYTAIGYENYRNFLGLQADFSEKYPVEKKFLGNLADVMSWLFGSFSQHQQPVIASQNPDLKRLNDVLGSREATEALRVNRYLDSAYDMSKGGMNVLYESLMAAKLKLEKAASKIGEYDGDEDYLKTSGTITTMAERLYEQMLAIRNEKRGTKKQRITE